MKSKGFPTIEQLFVRCHNLLSPAGTVVNMPKQRSYPHPERAWWGAYMARAVVEAQHDDGEDWKFLAMDLNVYANTCCDELHYSEAALVRGYIGATQVLMGY